ncbi:MAG: hypothetical protein D3925_15080, partial [Candidatus Electrothrix sp. AR5]|nr:hypothetical protein [Candidatus Electrothrix sp. AR5]
KSYRTIVSALPLNAGLIEMTLLGKPRSPKQCYRLTLTGQAIQKKGKGADRGDLLCSVFPGSLCYEQPNVVNIIGGRRERP